MNMNASLMDDLRENHPGPFKTWDGFEVVVSARVRKGMPAEVMVNLYNAGSGDTVVDLHSCFLLSSNDDGSDNIRVGREDLSQEWFDCYVPDQYRN